MSENKRKRNGGQSSGKSKDKSKKVKLAASTIQPGVSGIFATCNRNREKQCAQELLDLFNEEAASLYDLDAQVIESDPEDNEADIEASISKELESLKKSKERSLFTAIDISCECVIFFRTKKPVIPTDFVHKLCENASQSGAKTTRYALRLSPVTLTASANESDLRGLAQKVFAPHFHVEGQEPLKFAIRPTIRNHTTLTRDQIIQIVASEVGQPHVVDLNNYDRLIVVECFKNIVGLSVVKDFEKYKRFNLQQIFESKANEKEGNE